ncbi:hypothetical protein shim_22250 [Shimia sp. SK013]|uniref:Abi-alpha family protein n=1 Tax=Shimia sp. SK013 TaxID=1389006 RepID=UPI0006B4D718|nr:hypothetical protein [Shimia sp. SK013]KPA21518.1 hypothetical protein shim_22250 [Shimia sp. SK013]
MNEDNPLPVLPSQAVVEIVKAASGGAGDGIRSTVTDVWGGLIGDRVKLWRQRNLVNSLEKTWRILNSNGISTANLQALPDGELYRVFEGASKCDEPNLQSMWGGLLANALRGNTSEETSQRVSSTLSTMSGFDARLLKLIVDVDEKLSDFNDARIAKLNSFREGELEQKEEAGKVDEFRRRLHDDEIEFKNEVAGIIAEQGMEDSTFRELAKAQLIALHLIQPLGGQKASSIFFNRRYPGLFVSNSKRDFDKQVQAAFQELHRQSEHFEDWASERLLSMDREVFVFREGKEAKVNFELSDFGKVFLSIVDPEFF